MKARIESGKVVKYNNIPDTLKSNSGTILNASKLSSERLEELGFSDVIIPEYDHNIESIYNIHFDNELNAFTYDIKDRDYGVTLDQAKSNKSNELKANTHGLLSVTDWYITRKVELDIDVPTSILDDRKSIRDNHDTKEAEITALTSIIEVLNYTI
jgi:hypothetical protein